MLENVGRFVGKIAKPLSKSTSLGAGFLLSQISNKRSYSQNQTSKRDFPCLLKSTRFAGNVMKPYFKSTVLHVSVSLGQVFNKECDEQSLGGGVRGGGSAGIDFTGRLCSSSCRFSHGFAWNRVSQLK